MAEFGLEPYRADASGHLTRIEDIERHDSEAFWMSAARYLSLTRP